MSARARPPCSSVMIDVRATLASAASLSIDNKRPRRSSRSRGAGNSASGAGEMRPRLPEAVGCKTEGVLYTYGHGKCSLRIVYLFYLSSGTIVRTLAVAALVLLLGSVVLDVAPAQAESRTAPEATQHALDELANCLARHGAGYPAGDCPTATPTPTVAALSAPSVTPTVTVTPAPDDPTPTPLPVLPVGGASYTRPLDEHWLELAVLQGRWAVYQTDDCNPRVSPWANAVTQVQEDGEVDLISDAADCGLVAEQWLSDTPCSVDDGGNCNVGADLSYWDWLSHMPTPTPTLVPAATPPRLAAQPSVRQSAAALAPTPQVRTVVQTVVVVVTAEPMGTPELAAASTPAPTQTPRLSPSATLTATATVSPIATGTPTVLAIESLARPTSQAPTVAGERQVGRWDWGGFLLTAVLVVAVVSAAIWALTRRKVVRWGARPKPLEDNTHAV